MSKTQRRHKTGFGYIGFGNDMNVFNRKAQGSFSDYKERLHAVSQQKHELDFDHHALTKEERQVIKNKIKKQIAYQNKKALAIVLVIIITIVVVFKDFLWTHFKETFFI
ncbi:hypothetical protein LRR18_13990 [Mangrovimonas sp. AS39]|uniref:hypothetical protein n=2 Tax=Mangrovimonas futianensis TaxID=2895523 RepID=UPI001E2948D6|nr:hypothetical protein [Mangrovimonas futianensis]MCF1192703.1 hypothetical protein [Mangrovimonas futianensis]